MMKKLFLTTSLIALTGGAALAADLPSRKAEAVLPSSPPMWAGVYAGLNAGYGFGTNENSQSIAFASQQLVPGYPNYLPSFTGLGEALTSNAPLSQSGFIGGGQIGYNYQWNSNIVVGIEADIQGSGISGSGRGNGVGAASIIPGGGNIFTFYSVGSTGVNAGVDWMGTVRGRLGYLWTPTMLLYATGGLTYGGASANVMQSGLESRYIVNNGFKQNNVYTGGGTRSQALVGWNIGGGLEWMFMPNWSVKAEGIYWNMGSQNVATAAYSPTRFFYGEYDPKGDFGSVPGNAEGGTRVNYQGVIARMGLNYHFNFSGSAPSALAADLPSRKTEAVQPSSPPMWTGVYAGLNAGYGFGTNENSQSNVFAKQALNAWDYINFTPTGLGEALTSNAPLSQSGFIGGGQIGYNYQWNSNIVVGIEADIQGSGISGTGRNTGVGVGGPVGWSAVQRAVSFKSVGSTSVNAGVDWMGTVRGRLGYLWTPTMLLYATGGLTYGGASANVHNYGVESFLINFSATNFLIGNAIYTGGGTRSQALVGWNIGGGLEWMFMPNWSVKAEGIYWNMGSQNVATAAYFPGFSNNNNVLSGRWGDPNVAEGGTRVNYQGVIARMGLNYHFNFSGSAPIAANF